MSRSVMPPIFAKLNLRDQPEILVVNSPDSFEKALSALRGIKVHRRLAAAGALQFALVFVTQRGELDRLAKALTSRASGDVVLWFAYPKGTSKKYSCDFNRDDGWDLLRQSGFDSVRQVAIDADWSALRFRRVEFIKRA
jgi:hypothetical protein